MSGSSPSQDGNGRSVAKPLMRPEGTRGLATMFYNTEERVEWPTRKKELREGWDEWEMDDGVSRSSWVVNTMVGASK